MRQVRAMLRGGDTLAFRPLASHPPSLALAGALSLLLPLLGSDPSQAASLTTSSTATPALPPVVAAATISLPRTNRVPTSLPPATVLTTLGLPSSSPAATAVDGAATADSSATAASTAAVCKWSDIAAEAVPERSAVRLVREAGLAASLLRAVGEPLLGLPSATTRKWLSSLLPHHRTAIDAVDPAASPLFAAWVAAHDGVAMPTPFTMRIVTPGATADGDAAGGSEPAAASVAAGVAPLPISHGAAPYPVAIATPTPCVPPATQAAFLRLGDRLFDACAKALIIDHVALKRSERRNDAIQFARGMLSERTLAEHEEKRLAFQRTLALTTALADALDRQLPTLPEVSLADDDESAATRRKRLAELGAAGGSPYAPFDDLATYMLYWCVVPVS